MVSAPTASSIEIDKTEVENDDRLKSVIKNYFKRQRFITGHSSYQVRIVAFYDVSVKSISGTTFIVDLDFETMAGAQFNNLEKATAKIEKTADSYKIISFDRFKQFDEKQAEVERKALEETQLALLSVPTVSSILVDKAEVENDDHLKSVITNYFKKKKFKVSHGTFLKTSRMIAIYHISVKSISGSTFIVDLKYETSTGGGQDAGGMENAMAKIEKTAVSYKVLSFDRDKQYDEK